MSVAVSELARFELLRNLPDDDLERLATSATGQRLRDGEALFVAGEPARSMYAVADGKIALRATVGERSTVVMTVEAGELVGWSALRDDATWLTTGRAVGEAAVVALPVGAVLDLIASGSPAARGLIRRLFGLAAAHLAETQAQLLRPGYEGPITGG